MSSPFILRWGIVGCGRISGNFVKDIVLPSPERDAADVAHAVVACGSRDVAKAEKFIFENCPQGAYAQTSGLLATPPVPKGSYAEVYTHPDVDIIYVGTPHNCHYEDAKNALEAGKHVLLEKPATLNRAEWDHLVEIAKAKKLFLMEAVWTRFFPLTYALQDVLFKEEAIGEVRRVVSDFSIDFFDLVTGDHRMKNPDLAGGGLLDLGPYPLVWAMLVLFHHPKNELTPPAQIKASMFRNELGIDEFTDWTLDFPKLGARASLSVSIKVNSPGEAVTRIQGSKGEIILPYATARPTKFTIRKADISRGPPAQFVEEVKEFPIPGLGLNWEADAVARAIRDGVIDHPRMPWSDTALTMSILDEVRKQGGYTFAEGMEKVKL